jgi:predicted  nucleic acid-binding Zn-ribbon protein
MNDTPTETLQKAIDKLAERQAGLAERQAALETFNALVRLSADPSACKARIDQLKRALDKAEAAEQKLTERQAAFDAKVATEKAELDERKSALNARALQLSHREAAAEQIIARDKTNRLNRSRPLAGGMSITQEQP